MKFLAESHQFEAGVKQMIKRDIKDSLFDN